MDRIGWKLLFVVLLLGTLAGSYEDLTAPGVVKPTHPLWISALVWITDLLTLVSAFCYGFRKRFFPCVLFWQAVLGLSVLSNLVVCYYAFSRPGAFQPSELAVIMPIDLAVLVIFLLPTYLYFAKDLSQAKAAGNTVKT